MRPRPKAGNRWRWARPTRTRPTADSPGRPGSERALDLLGIARKAGHLVLGTHAVKEAARRGELAAAVMARDATANAKARVLPLLSALEVPVAWCAEASRLSASLGRSRTVVVGLRDVGLAERVLEALESNGTDTDLRMRGSNEESV